jgi:IPT/TIG domain/Galactose oxidase, central domain/Kelch motif
VSPSSAHRASPSLRIAAPGGPAGPPAALIPLIESVSQPFGYVGTSVTVSGVNFGSVQGTSSLTFSGVQADVVSWTSTTIVAVVPSGATTGNVGVRVGGVASNGVTFTVFPHIDGISPGIAVAGASVAISGTGFGNAEAASGVSFSGTLATVVNWSATAIQVVVPNGATPGTIAVVVNGVSSNGVLFTVPPQISAVSPSAARPGYAISITGTNFGTARGVASFGGTPATSLLWSDTVVDVVVPQEATSGNLVIHTAGGISSPPVYFAVTGFTATGNLNSGRNGQRAVVLNDGTVLVAGGWSTSSVLASAELYTPQTKTFSPTGSMNAARANDTITLLDDGTVLVAGGYDSSGHVLASAEIYDPATSSFTPTGNLATARANHIAARLSDGTVLIAGGMDSAGNSLSSAELYIPATGTFVPTGDLQTPRAWSTTTTLNNGNVLIAGGQSGPNTLADAELYNVATKSFTETGSLNVARTRHTATLLNTGMVLIAGGAGNSGAPLASTELYDPTSGAFTATSSLFMAEADHTATLLSDGTVLITGGFVCPPSNCTTVTPASNWATLYDPTTGTFSVAITQLNAYRQSHTATRLPDGTVLVAGGWGYDATLKRNPAMATAELYQPNPLTLAPANLRSIAVKPGITSISIGTSEALAALGTVSSGMKQTLASVTWSSSNTAVATVTNDSGSNSGVGNDSSNSGVVFGKSAGVVVIQACDGPICGSATVNIVP